MISTFTFYFKGTLKTQLFFTLIPARVLRNSFTFNSVIKYPKTLTFTKVHELDTL